MRMFVTLAVEAMERTGAVAEHRPHVLFCLDEFAALDRVESIEKAAGQIAGFGVKLWPVIQDLTQLQRFSATTTSPGCKLAIILSWPPAGADPCAREFQSQPQPGDRNFRVRSSGRSARARPMPSHGRHQRCNSPKPATPPPLNQARLTNRSGQNIITLIRGSRCQVADIKSERWRASSESAAWLKKRALQHQDCRCGRCRSVLSLSR